jgi:hypothetical protein
MELDSSRSPSVRRASSEFNLISCMDIFVVVELTHQIFINWNCWRYVLKMFGYPKWDHYARCRFSNSPNQLFPQSL